jgi:hypothetical protein
MPLLNSPTVVGMIEQQRVVYLGGRQSSGKSLLMHVIARELMEHYGYRYMLSNCPSVWADDPQVVFDNMRDDQFIDAVICMDEAGQWMRTAAEAERYLALLGKINAVLILASWKRPAAVLRSMTVQRSMNLMKLGLPVWLYELHLHDGVNHEKVRFALTNPKQYFGLYSTRAAAVQDTGIGDFLEDVQARLVHKFGESGNRSTYKSRQTNRKRLQEPQRLSDVEGFGGYANIIMEAAETIADSVSLPPARTGQKRRRKS